MLISISLFIAAVAIAQNGTVIEERIIDTIPMNKKGSSQKTVVIRMNGDKTKQEKMIIEVDGNKVKINGKDASEFKDIDIDIVENSIMHRNPITKNYSYKTFPQSRLKELGIERERITSRKNNLFNNKVFIEKRINTNGAVLGIQMEKIEEGVKILSITKESAAEKAGLKEGDVVVKIDETPIQVEMDITKLILTKKPNDEIIIQYKRAGKLQTTKAVLGKRLDLGNVAWPNEKDSFKFEHIMPMEPFEMPMQNFNFKMDGNFPDVQIFKNGELPFDMHYNHMGLKLGVALMETETDKGLEITNVEEGSVANKAGLQKGDIITKIGNETVKTVADVKNIIKENSKNPFAIYYLRNGKEQKVEVVFPKKLKEINL
jgi:serine protease Do